MTYYVMLLNHVVQSVLSVSMIYRHQGDTVVNILIDLNGFWSYENREVLVADQGDGDSGESNA